MIGDTQLGQEIHEAYAYYAFLRHMFCSRQFLTGIVTGAARSEFGKGLIIPF